MTAGYEIKEVTLEEYLHISAKRKVPFTQRLSYSKWIKGGEAYPVRRFVMYKGAKPFFSGF